MPPITAMNADDAVQSARNAPTDTSRRALLQKPRMIVSIMPYARQHPLRGLAEEEVLEALDRRKCDQRQHEQDEREERGRSSRPSPPRW
jgi:hypothetical protein